MKVSARKCGKKSRNKKKHHKAKSKQRGPRYWMAMGTMSALLAYAPVVNKRVEAAASGSALSAGRVWEMVYVQDPAQGKKVFDIPPGTLETVLTAFQNLTGLKVIIPDDKMRTIYSPGVSGANSVQQALAQILVGTGIGYRFTDPTTVTLELKKMESSVEILGSVTLTSPKYSEPLLDTPQTINIIPKAVIEEQGATTLRDVLRNVPGLTVAAGEGGTPAGDNLVLRGFSARNDIFVDGVRDLSPQSRDPFNLEQVEVVKGPSSSFNGRGSAGGTINLITKAPNIRPSYGGTFNLGTDDTKRVTTDFNIPFKDRYAFRLNLLGHESGVADRNIVENKRWGIAPSLATGIGTRTRFTFSYYHLQQRNISDYGIPWVPANNTAPELIAYRDKPAPVPRDTFYGFRDRDVEKMGTDLGTVTFEHDFSDNLTMRNQTRYGWSTRDSIATPPRFSVPGNQSMVNRELRSWITEDSIWDNQTDLRTRASTGKVDHALVFGLALTRENNTRQLRNQATPTVLQTTTLLNPNPDDVYTGGIVLSPFVGNVTGDTTAFYAMDTVKLSKRWEFNGSLRYDYFDVEGVSAANNGLTPVDRVDRMFSGRAGIVFKPRPDGSFYASYGTSVNPSLEGLSYNPASALVDPEKTYTVEVGTKWNLVGERLLLSGAVFNVDKTNARTPDPVDTTLTVLQGRLRVQGFELGASGSITRLWRVLAGYTFLDSRIVESNTLAEVGKRFVNTPRNSFNVWTTYSLKRKLDLGGGIRFVGRRFGNNTNSRWVDNYFTIDATASYPITSKIDLRLNLYNLNDAYYFDRLGGGHVVPGAGRSVMLSTGFRF
jgi:catecholate siderophore receptor